MPVRRFQLNLGLTPFPNLHHGLLSTSKKAIEMLRLERDNEAMIIRNYSERILQCEDLAEYAICEQIRGIQIDKQIHQASLTTVLSKNASNQFQAA
jgi:hypothetical protein